MGALKSFESRAAVTFTDVLMLAAKGKSEREPETMPREQERERTRGRETMHPNLIR